MADLTILYDGGCPLCMREVTMLQRRDQRRNGEQPRLAFVDIDPADYDPSAHGGITYREAMGRIHGLTADGEVLRDLTVFRRAYELVGLGWIYAPTRWPLVGELAAAAYDLWARLRLRLTGRPSLDQLCAARGQACGVGSRPVQPTAVEAMPVQPEAVAAHPVEG
ncbi:MAG: thiol-disulfide oxidoreductase DCC family protein [Cyanobacteriota bacterium]|jgi:predicted DCC family thiol-disulfide oxidoreductase YuxK